MQTLWRVSQWIRAAADTGEQHALVFSHMGARVGLGQRGTAGLAAGLVASASDTGLENRNHGDHAGADVVDV